MVSIVAHRGWWETPEEQNTIPAFERAFDAGVGVELDVRDGHCDHGTFLFVSHDPVDDPLPCLFDEVLELLGDRDNYLAVNVKSCGLAPWFAKLKAPKNWFFFDVAEADERSYKELELPLWHAGTICRNRPTLVISEEVFGRATLTQWDHLRELDANIVLITDRVAEALEFFK